jgi:hypothetical protein
MVQEHMSRGSTCSGGGCGIAAGVRRTTGRAAGLSF